MRLERLRRRRRRRMSDSSRRRIITPRGTARPMASLVEGGLSSAVFGVLLGVTLGEALGVVGVE